MDLKERARAGGWHHIPNDRYPLRLLWDWLEENHPEQLKDYKKWFDEEVRD